MDAEQGKKPTSLDIRRVRQDQTTAIATATMETERKARREKTEHLRAAREAAEAQHIER